MILMAYLLGHTGTGACLLYGISRVVIGENKTFLGGDAYLRQRGVEVVVLDDVKCRELMEKFIAEKPDVWYVSAPLPARPFHAGQAEWLIWTAMTGMKISELKRGCTPRRAKQPPRSSQSFLP